MKVIAKPESKKCDFALLAPPQVRIPRRFERVETNSERHQRLLHGVQELRGHIYLEEGAIRAAELSADGRHELPVDESAWHVLSLDGTRQLQGCSRYLAHSNQVAFGELSLRTCPLAISPTWGSRFQRAVECEIALARRRGIAYVEVGGWALRPEQRGSAEALRIALATYSLARILGGCIGIATATHRHGSSSILRRIGGHRLSCDGVEFPTYFDPQYGCAMDVVRFDSQSLNTRFEGWVEDLSEVLHASPVVHRELPILLPAARPPLVVPEYARFGALLAAAV